MMKIVLHDYAGHPFQAQLSRQLAARGHRVDHVYCASHVSGKGDLTRDPTDADSLKFSSLTLREEQQKYHVSRRFWQEFEYARSFIDHLRRSPPPDVVVMCNVPLLAHLLIDRYLRLRRLATVFWHQDIYSTAISEVARRRWPRLGPLVGKAAVWSERSIANAADSVVVITESFLPVHHRWGTPADKLKVLANWAPAHKVAPHPKDNEWSRRHGVATRPVLMYAGTLGIKHDVDCLLSVFRGVRERVPSAELVVLSEGPVAERLAESEEPGVTVLPYQPFADLPLALASADVLVTVLDSSASEYSVPSKTLTYLCAGRPVLALVPAGNPTAHIVAEAGGLVAEPTHAGVRSAVEGVVALLQDELERCRLGTQARRYAERTFDIAEITTRFEGILQSAADAARSRATAFSSGMEEQAVQPSGASSA